MRSPLEEGTTVLSFGGPPTFKPSDWEGRWLRESARAGAQGVKGLPIPVSPRGRAPKVR